MRNANFFDMARGHLRAGLADVDRKWGWYLALGIFLILVGSVAAAMAVATTLISVVVLGWVLVFAGAGLTVLSFLTARWSGFLVSLVAGILSVIVGIVMLSSPLVGATALTLMVATILIAAGIYRTVASAAMQFPNWGWSFLSGVISLALGALLLKDWQTASLWFIGLYVGIDLIFHGFSWVMFALRVHGLAKDLDITEADRRPRAA